MRLLFQTLPSLNKGNIAKVYGKNEYNEYVVKFYNHLGIHMDASDCFTNDLDDAIGTALLEDKRN